MSKKNGVMDWYFQEWNIRRHIRCYSDIHPDFIDINGLLDRSLHLPENIEMIENEFKITRWNLYELNESE